MSFLSINPRVLVYDATPFGTQSSSLTLRNTHPSAVYAFKIRVTAPKRYSPKPVFGFLKPGEAQAVTIRLSFEHEPMSPAEIRRLKDRIQVLELPLPDLFESSEAKRLALVKSTFSSPERQSEIQFQKICCSFLSSGSEDEFDDSMSESDSDSPKQFRSPVPAPRSPPLPNPGGCYFSPKLLLKRTAGGGQVFAQERIEKDELVVAWVGFLATYAQLQSMSEEQRSHTLQIDEDLYQYPMTTPSLEPADFVNHSCEPNCGIRGQVSMVARRTIWAGEEITYDYAMSDGSPFDEFDCFCGGVLCRGRVTGNDWRLPHLWEKYKGYFSSYLERRIERLKQQQQAIGEPS